MPRVLHGRRNAPTSSGRPERKDQSMARITVEDCIEAVPSRFELVLVAGQRARELNAGARSTVDIEEEKTTVVALREIAAGNLELDALREKLVRGQQRIAPPEEPPADEGLDSTDIASSLSMDAPMQYEDDALTEVDSPDGDDLADA
jgi:DNA-directed RNA polymerase subunit omega